MIHARVSGRLVLRTLKLTSSQSRRDQTARKRDAKGKVGVHLREERRACTWAAKEPLRGRRNRREGCSGGDVSRSFQNRRDDRVEGFLKVTEDECLNVPFVKGNRKEELEQRRVWTRLLWINRKEKRRHSEVTGTDSEGLWCVLKVTCYRKEWATPGNLVDAQKWIGLSPPIPWQVGVHLQQFQQRWQELAELGLCPSSLVSADIASLK